MQILFISLGCDKTLVDSEEMLGLLENRGYTVTDDETAADIIVVNTCCFIHDARKRASRRYWIWRSTVRKEGQRRWL